MSASTRVHTVAVAVAKAVGRRWRAVEPVVETIAARHRRGWDTARIVLWLRNLLREPSRVAQTWFVDLVTSQL
jgi:hypothetical protein